MKPLNKNNMKKTAVEQLADKLPFELKFLLMTEIEQAKEMEKEQIIDAFQAAEKDCGRDFLHGDLYYNETFKSE